MVYTGLPVKAEGTVLPNEQIGNPFSRWGTVDLEIHDFSGALIPACEDEAGIVHIVVKVVMGEKKVINLTGQVA